MSVEGATTPEKGRVIEASSVSVRRAGGGSGSAPAVRNRWASGGATDRACLIADLRNAILNGTYHHDAMTIADRLLDRLPGIGAAEF